MSGLPPAEEKATCAAHWLAVAGHAGPLCGVGGDRASPRGTSAPVAGRSVVTPDEARARARQTLRALVNRTEPRAGDHDPPNYYDLDAPKLVELRCARRRHLLGLVYDTPPGPFVVAVLHLGRGELKGDSGILVDQTGVAGRLDQVGESPVFRVWAPGPEKGSVCDVQHVAPRTPVAGPAEFRCSCGTQPVLRSALMKDVATAKRTGRLMKIVVGSP